MVAEIYLHVKRGEDILFNSVLQASANRTLNVQVEEYLVEEAEKTNGQKNIVIHLKTDEQAPDTTEIGNFIHKHFSYLELKSRQAAKKIIALGWKSLWVSFMFLMLMFLIAYSITVYLPENALVITVKELFVILGWVALWRPADLLLYDWRPFRRKEKIYAKLASSRVVID